MSASFKYSGIFFNLRSKVNFKVKYDRAYIFYWLKNKNIPQNFNLRYYPTTKFKYKFIVEIL